MNARTLIRSGKSLDEVERYYREGRIGQATMETYALLWRKSAVRYSSEWASFGEFDPRAARIARRMTS